MYKARSIKKGFNPPTSLTDLTKALVAEWKQDPAAMFQRLVESLPRRLEAVIASKGGTNSTLMPMILECDVRRAGVHMLLVKYCV
jgi:hypothetical protein